MRPSPCLPTAKPFLIRASNSAAATGRLTVTLHLVAAIVVKIRQLLVRLDALGNHFQSQAVCQRNDRRTIAAPSSPGAMSRTNAWSIFRMSIRKRRRYDRLERPVPTVRKRALLNCSAVRVALTAPTSALTSARLAWKVGRNSSGVVAVATLALTVAAPMSCQ